MKSKKDRRLIEIINIGHAAWAGWIGWGWVEGKWEQVGKYIKYPGNSNAQRYLKKVSNKKVRKYKSIKSGCAYRRLFDYWWILD